jgi:hypothetical protein
MPACSGFAPNRAHYPMLAKTMPGTCLYAPSLGAQGISAQEYCGNGIPSQFCCASLSRNFLQTNVYIAMQDGSGASDSWSG